VTQAGSSGVRLHRGFPPPGWLGESFVTIGTFDGLHRGHLSLLQPLVSSSRQAGAHSVLVTFDPHPRCVLDPQNCPPLLTTLEEKIALADSLGLNDMVMIPFTRELADLLPGDFFGQLQAGIDIRQLLVGYNFAFGRDRRGDVAFLRNLAARDGFQLTVCEPVTAGGGPISSSRIRRLLAHGRVRAAGRLLGRDYDVHSVVQTGSGRGKGLGFPTANLAIPKDKLLPPTGVYAARAKVDGRPYQAAVNLGFRPTFEGKTLTLEAFLLDYDGDSLYGKQVTLSFVHRLRGEQKFGSVVALQEQIGKDVALARRALNR
jgi:riboflavin kinase/FMN adenylyltransferase